MTEVVLEARELTAGYVPDLPILRGVSMRAMRGQITLIIGPNGAGKSTLIKAIAGLVQIGAGNVTFEGTDITGLRTDKLASRGIAYVPQNDNIFRSLTIRQNLDLALRRANVDASVVLNRIFNQFQTLDVKQNDKAGSLSGGQRQFLAIAMAFAAEPRLILMDEPSAGLSPKASQKVLEHTRTLASTGVSILLVEQNVNQAMRLSDHCYILAEGRNQIDGPADDLLNDKAVGEIYLGGRRVGRS